MLRFSKKTDYALLALGHLSQASEPVSARFIAERYTLPLNMTSQIMKELAKRGLIKASRGSNGGYRLTHSPEKVSIREVLEITEGPLQLVECIRGGNCSSNSTCIVKGAMFFIQNEISNLLQDLSLKDLANSMPKK